MLPGILGMLAGVAGTGVSASYLSQTDMGDTGSSVSFTGYGIGAAATDRRIIVAVHWREGGTHRDLSSATIGGVSATIHIQDGHSGGATGFGAAIISAIVPTGTTATVALTFSGALGTNGGVGISGLRVTGLANSSPHDTAFDENAGSAGNLSGTINVPAGGVTFAVYTSSTNAAGNAVSWTGVTEQYDLIIDGGNVRASMAWDDDMTQETGRTIGVTTASESDAGNAFVAVSWN